MTIYATTDDVIAFRGSVDASTLALMPKHLEACSSRLRLFGKKAGVDVDELYEGDEDIALIITQRVCDSAYKKIESDKGSEPLMSQFTESAGGYSMSGTLVNIGGDYYFPKAFLKDIGIYKQGVGIVEVFEWDSSEE